MEFHCFKKQKKLKNGKIVHRWYYYYVDEYGKQHQKACKDCKTRVQAEDYVRSLCQDGNTPLASVLVRDIAKDMFVQGSDHLKRLSQLGSNYDVLTLDNARIYIRYIIDKWGDTPLARVDSTEVTKFLITQDRSGGWKNRYIRYFKEIYKEASWQGYKIPVPHFDRFTNKSQKADVLTTAELNALFVPENFETRMFYTMFLLCLSGGLRLGEVRAVRRRQIYFEQKVLLIDGFCKRTGERTTYNKTGSPSNPRHRFAYLPDRTLNELSCHIRVNSISEQDLLFTEKPGKPVSTSRAEYVFYKAIDKAGIIAGARKIVCHSLRYTYVTRMRRELSAETVMKMVGHTDVNMTDYYTSHKAVDEAIAAITDASHAVNDLFV